jgi:hypothetical protein
MARIRTIKPSFWTDSKMVRLSPLARLFYIGLWNFTDCDSGHAEDDPAALKRLILPEDDVDPEALMRELVHEGRVARIQTVSGRKYLHVIRLANHQKLDSRWSPRCQVCTETHPNSRERTDTQPNSLTLAGTPRNSAQDRTGQDSKKRTSSTASRSTDDDPAFAAFWNAYPRKVGKGEARKAWTKILKAGVDPTTVIAGAERYRDDPTRQRKDIEFTKHPGPWLNAERWTDQPDAQAANGSPRGWWDN